MICVTGGAGFIGLNFVKYLQEYTNKSFFVVDNFTYAANKQELINTGAKYARLDISDATAVNAFFDNSRNITTIFHFAAESHVDNSIQSCKSFIETNILGTVNLLNQCVKRNIRLIHMSTDEVYGSISAGQFNESSVFNPRNPYSASKSAAEHFIAAYDNTYGLNYNIINSSNNYGPYQHQEKLIPKTIFNCIHDIPVPIYGKGLQVRDWIYVSDTCSAIHAVYAKGTPNTRYCVGSNTELTNIEIVERICDLLDKPKSLLSFVSDRPGHDARYATDSSKLQQECQWSPKISIGQGLQITVNHFKEKINV